MEGGGRFVPDIKVRRGNARTEEKEEGGKASRGESRRGQLEGRRREGREGGGIRRFLKKPRCSLHSKEGSWGNLVHASESVKMHASLLQHSSYL